MTNNNKHNIQVNSEIGKLDAVIIHTPGQEVENMTPANAEKALYSDILNLPISQQEHSFFEGSLSKVSKTYQLRDLLTTVLEFETVREDLIKQIFTNQKVKFIDTLLAMDAANLSANIIEGIELQNNTLSNYLNPDRFAVQPLHNFFFMRDASVSIGNEVLISQMASKVRQPETYIMTSIFQNHPELKSNIIELPKHADHQSLLMIEGGDVHIAREDIILIGMGARSNSAGIDSLIEHYKKTKVHKHLIIQELPHSPESFIHLDMVFTLLDKDRCMVYEDVILKPSTLRTIHIEVAEGKLQQIHDEKNILIALANLGMELKPIICGGTMDKWHQEREQWHSGANFFSFAPGKALGYARNIHTLNALNNDGFEIITAEDVISGKRSVDDYKRCIVSIEGSELARGGGGARCMTMPIRRQEVIW
ncbi:MAG: arginine deiminase [Bacteroidales bacterium]|nr:arginine deiminase [Bacteroidales bacterium]